MKYILLAKDGVDLYNIDGAPFNERYHISEVDDDKVREIFGSDINRVLILGQSVFDRVNKLVHFPIRKAKFNNLFGLSALTLSTGCKVKCQEDWNKYNCQSIFHESWIQATDPDRPEIEKIYTEFNEEAEAALRHLIDLPVGSLFGYDYETSGLPTKTIEQENFRYKELQGLPHEATEYTGKTLHITGVSICYVDMNSDFAESYYFDVLSIVNGDPIRAKKFWSMLKEFLDKHSETNWTYNSNFETTLTYHFLHKFYVFQDAAAVNYIEGRHMHRQSLKLTSQRINKIRSWDDAFDDLIDKLNYLLSDAFQVDWNNGTVVQDGVVYVWYESPYFADAFAPYGLEMIPKAKELAKKSFMNPFMCIPAEILGSYCNIDSYSTAILAKYMYKRYSKDCIDVFASNLRFHVYLNSTGNYIDSNEYQRQKSIANKASNWGMLILWQELTRLEISQFEESHKDLDKDAASGSEILTWCLNNRVGYNKDNKAMLNAMLSSCINWDYENQVDVNRLHDAFPWDYSYDAIMSQIQGWGGLGNIFAKKNPKFWNGNAWIVAEYGTYDDDKIAAVNTLIYYKSLLRRREWLLYLSNLIPNWDSDVPEYVTLAGANNRLVDEFESSDGREWYESPEFTEYAKALGLPTTTEHPHYFISGCLNVGAASGMEYVKNQLIHNTDGWVSNLVISWMQYDSYVFGSEYESEFYKLDFDDYDIWNKVKNLKFIPQRLMISPTGEIVECYPMYDGMYTEMYTDIETPVGIVHKAFNCRELSDDERNISKHPELMNVEMLELDWEDHIGYRYLYVDHFLSKEHFIALYNHLWKRDIRGYKDFMECNCTGFGYYEMITLAHPWNWKAINSTKLDATHSKLDEIRPILGLYTWRKFRKILGTYLKNLLIEGAQYTKPEYTEKDHGLVISEYNKPEWTEGWDICRGHPNWNCMGVHTKRWCLAGDTPILMLDGRTLPIKDMQSEVGNYVYSYDTESKRYVPGKIIAWDITGRNQKVYKVKFDTGLEVKATDNHQFMRSDGTYVALRDMKVNDSIMPIKLKFDGNGEKLHDGRKWLYTVATLYGDQMPDNSRYQYHHKDGNHWNNRPDNIEILSNYEHHSHHGAELGHKYGGKFTNFRNSDWQSEMGRRKKPGTSDAMKVPGSAAKRRYDFVLYHNETVTLYKSGNLNESTYNALRSTYGRKWIYWCNVCKFYGGEDKVYELLSRYVGNSRVVSIEFCGYEDVYDIEVDKYHNFAIGDRSKLIRNADRKNGSMYMEGIMVHNSSGFHTLFGNSDTKKIITVPGDKLFFYLDISQAEPRTLAYKSGDPLMKGWYEAGKDIYVELAKLFNPDIVNATYMTDEQKKARLKELRGLYKVLVLAIMYGMGNGALAGMTGKPLNVAKKYKRDFLDAMPELEKFIEARVNYPSKDNPSVMTILGDYLELYEWDEPRWKRQGINFCIQSFSALCLVSGFENMVRTALHDGLTFSPIGTVHDSSQMIMDAKFIYNCQAHFDLNYTEYLYKRHGVKYKGDIKIGVNYYDLAKMHVVDDTTIELEGTADSINKIIRNLRNGGVTDMKLDVDEASIVPDYYSSVPKQVARTFGGGAMPDKSSYKVKITFGDDVLQYHRGLVTGHISKSEVSQEHDNLHIDSSEFDDNEETETED